MDTEARTYLGPAAVPLLCDRGGNLDDVIGDMLDVLGIASRSQRFSQTGRLKRKLNLSRSGSSILGSKIPNGQRPFENQYARLAALKG